MNIRKFLAGLTAVAVVSGALPSLSVVAGSPLPAGAGDFVPTVDLAATLSDLAQLANTQCNVVSSNVTSLPVGEPFSLPVDPMKGLLLVNGLKSRADSAVAMACTPAISMAGTERTVTGTITSQALGASGTFTLACTFEQNLKVTADLVAGLGLAKGASVTVKSADKTIPMTCSMSATLSDGTSMSGTVDGVAKVGSDNSDACVGDGQLSCVPLAIDANVNVTSTTGKLSGFTGKGTYSLKPSFTIAKLNDELGNLKNFIGKQSVGAFSVVSRRFVPRAVPTAGTMKIDFAPGAARTDIVHPAVRDGVSMLAEGSYIAATGPRSTKCVFAVSRAKKSFTLATVTSSATGVTPTRTVTTTQLTRLKKALGVKSGAKLTLNATCGATKASQSVTLG